MRFSHTTRSKTDDHLSLSFGWFIIIIFFFTFSAPKLLNN